MITPYYTQDNEHFVYLNPNPSQEGRRTLRWNKGDCAIRAFANACNISWIDSFDELCSIAREMYDVPNSMEVLKEGCRRNGGEWHAVKAEKGKKRMTAKEFALSHKKGAYILDVSNHLAAVVDGKIADTWDCGGKCIYGYIKIK